MSPPPHRRKEAGGGRCSVTELLEHNSHSELSPSGDHPKERSRTEMVKSVLGKYSPEQTEHRDTGHREQTRVQTAGQVPEQVTAEKGECCGLKNA